MLTLSGYFKFLCFTVFNRNMATAIQHQPIGFLPLCFSLSGDSVMRPPSSSSESLNDILDTMSDTDKDDQILGDAEKVCHFYIDKSSAKRINQNI